MVRSTLKVSGSYIYVYTIYMYIYIYVYILYIYIYIHTHTHTYKGMRRRCYVFMFCPLRLEEQAQLRHGSSSSRKAWQAAGQPSRVFCARGCERFEALYRALRSGIRELAHLQVAHYEVRFRKAQAALSRHQGNCPAFNFRR